MTAPTRSKNLQTENGFDFVLFPAKTEKPESLIIYMHGIGDNAENFGPWVKQIQDRIPGAEVISLQGPLEIKDPAIPPGQKGYGWFPYGGPVGPQAKTLLSHVFNRVAVVGQVQSFAHAQLAKRGLTAENLGYVGNSMGAIVALQAALNDKQPVAAVAARGGAVPPFTRAKNKPAVFLQMGEWDEIFNTPAPEGKGLKGFFAKLADRALSLRHGRSLGRLQKKNVPVTEKLYPMQGHMLEADAYADSADFLAGKVKQKPSVPKPAQGPGQGG